MQPERVALLLAAGFSRRYGSDKRLAGSPPLILRTLATLLPCHDSVLVVLRQRDETLRRLLADSGAELTQVPRDGGLGDSLAHGVRTLLASGRPIHSLLITLADMPHLSPASLRALQAAQTGREIVRPLHQGSRVILSASPPICSPSWRAWRGNRERKAYCCAIGAPAHPVTGRSRLRARHRLARGSALSHLPPPTGLSPLLPPHPMPPAAWLIAGQKKPRTRRNADQLRIH
ncbi:nucleotidyltransferase family protein [Aeromonas rivipollensis]